MVVVFYAGLIRFKAIYFKATLSIVTERIDSLTMNAMCLVISRLTKDGIMKTDFTCMTYASQYHSECINYSCSIDLFTCCAAAENPAACRALCKTVVDVTYPFLTLLSLQKCCLHYLIALLILECCISSSNS